MEHLAHLSDVLDAEFRLAGFVLTAPQLALATTHARELLAWNSKTNLTTVTRPREVAVRHFVESFAAARLIEGVAIGSSALDIGAGGGFPGLALRILRPDLRLTLLEPREKKAAFLASVARHHPAPRVTILRSRLEDLTDNGVTWDVVMFRAVRLSHDALARVLSQPDGMLLTYDSGTEVSSLLPSEQWTCLGSASLPGGTGAVRSWKSSSRRPRLQPP